MSRKPYPSFLNKDLGISVNFQSFLRKNNLFEDQIVLDIGCGKGFTMQCAIECKAAGVCGIDISEDDVSLCEEKFQKNLNVHVAKIDVRDVDDILEFVKKSMGGKAATMILCNPAQMPCPKPLPNGYFVGKDGRNMIENVLKFAKEALKTKSSVLYFGHSMLSNPMKTVAQCMEMGLHGEIVKRTDFEFEVYESIRHNAKLLNYWQEEFGFQGIMKGCIVKITREYEEYNKERTQERGNITIYTKL